MEGREDDTPQYASPPCFMHELDPEYRAPSASDQQEVDVDRWRRAERSSRIASRLALPLEIRRLHDEMIGDHVMKAIESAKEKVVGVFWPVRAEPDLRSLLARSAADGTRWALPVVIGWDRPLVFRQWTAGDRLEKDVAGIPAPVEGSEVQPDIVLAPVVSFDRGNYRLGYGDGLYDRTLATLPRKTLAIGIGYGSAYVRTIYPQAYDIPMDTIITEGGEVVFESSS